MLKKIKQLSVSIAAMFMLAVPVLAPVSVHAATATDGLCNGIDAANGSDVNVGEANPSCTTESTTGPNINSIIHTIINFFSLIVGAVSVIMIIFGGFKYITSGGNDGNVGKAKNTILYALIGLVIVALAQVIVKFVLTKATA